MRLPKRTKSERGEHMGHVIVRDVTVINGTGAEPIKDVSVVVKDGRIASIGPVAKGAESGAEVYDGRGKYMLPGLINLHDHLYHRAAHRGKAAASGTYKDIKRRFMELPPLVLVLAGARDCAVELSIGITTVRDCSTKHGISFALRRAIQEGFIPGPRILAAGVSIKMTGGHMYPNPVVADGPEELRLAVRSQIAEGADFIKLLATGSFRVNPERGYQSVDYTVEELSAAVTEAHRLGKGRISYNGSAVFLTWSA
jgi:imidazolonepropionase-like amidohydrolase